MKIKRSRIFSQKWNIDHSRLLNTVVPALELISYVIVFFRYAFLSDISYKERGYPCEYLQYIYVQSILSTSSEDFKSSSLV